VGKISNFFGALIVISGVFFSFSNILFAVPLTVVCLLVFLWGWS